MATVTLNPAQPPSMERFAAYEPAAPTPVAAIVQALSHLPQLEGMSKSDMEWLATHGAEHRFVDGTAVFRTGEPARVMTILLAGEVHVRRHQSGPVQYFIGRSGQLTGKLPYSRMQTYGGDGYAAGDVWSLSFDESCFPAMLSAIPSMGQRCVSVLLDRVREVTRMEQQSEKLNALGKLAANLSHELNNPASAARSAANNLWTELRTYGDQKYRLGSLCFDESVKQKYGEWVGSVRAMLPLGEENVTCDTVVLNEREDLFRTWLDAHNVADSWKIAPTLAETRIDVPQLEQLADIMQPEALPIAISSFASALKAERMTDAVMDATRRIFELITAIKDYSYMDQAPIQEVDLAVALDNTLAMFNSRLAAVDVQRAYDPATPPVFAYGSELNQVWTSIIENALDAMDLLPPGTPRILRLHTALSGPSVLVEVWDNGPGIEAAIQSRIFEPFFTTKPVGNGLGLGLDVANRVVLKHRGQISVQSKPGETCLQVRLPIEQTGAY